MSTKQALLTAVMVVALGGSWMLADDKPATPKADATSRPSPDQLDQWVRQMDSDKFDVRDKAVEKLTAAGKAAIPAVTKAAKGKSLEVTVRSIKVLKGLLESKDDDTKAAAQAALEELAKDEKHESGVQARDVLKSVRPRRPDGAIGSIVLKGGRLTVGAGGRLVIEGAVTVGGGKGMQISVTSVNGNKEINVEANGRKIKINENKDGIVVAVTEPAAGKKKAETKTYKAADAKELKKKHPEAHKLYEKYARGGMAQRIQVGNIVRPRVAPQVRPGRAKTAAARRAQLLEARKLIDEARKELSKAMAKLQDAVKASGKGVAGEKDKLGPDDWAEILKQIEAARKNLDSARKGLQD